MNSYPVELLAQPLPVMFVAGLEPAPAISPVVSPRSPPVPLTGTSPHSSPSPGFAHRVQTSNAQHDPFVILQQRLRDALTQVPKNTIWLADRGRTFQVLLVEKVRTWRVSLDAMSLTFVPGRMYDFHRARSSLQPPQTV